MCMVKWFNSIALMQHLSALKCLNRMKQTHSRIITEHSSKKFSMSMLFILEHNTGGQV